MDNKNSESNTWGGSRQGSGRKAVEHGKNYTFRSTPAVDAFLSSYKGNKNKFINEALERYISALP